MITKVKMMMLAPTMMQMMMMMQTMTRIVLENAII